MHVEVGGGTLMGTRQKRRGMRTPSIDVRKLLKQAAAVIGTLFVVEWLSRTLFWTIAYLRGHIVSEGGAGIVAFLAVPLVALFGTFLEEPLIVQYHTRTPTMTSPYYIVYIGAAAYTMAILSVGIAYYVAKK